MGASITDLREKDRWDYQNVVTKDKLEVNRLVREMSDCVGHGRYIFKRKLYPNINIANYPYKKDYRTFVRDLINSPNPRNVLSTSAALPKVSTKTPKKPSSKTGSNKAKSSIAQQRRASDMLDFDYSNVIDTKRARLAEGQYDIIRKSAETAHDEQETDEGLSLCPLPSLKSY